MSRIGKQQIAIPEKTTVTVNGTIVVVHGPLGELSRAIHPLIGVTIDSGKVITRPVKETKDSNTLWGTSLSHIENMIVGVNKAYEKKLIIEGIVYKAEIKGAELVLALGFSHPVKVKIPAGLKVTSEKGVISISGIDIEAVGSFAAAVRGLKKPEPYKGKGIRYEKEVIRRKEGKKTGTT